MALPYIVKQKLFAQLLEQSDFGIFILDDQFRYAYVNDIFARNFGLTRDEIIGKSINIYDEKALSVEAKLLSETILNDLLLKNFHQSTVEMKFRYDLPIIKANIKILNMHASGDIYFVGSFKEISCTNTVNLPNESSNFDPVTNLPNQSYFLVQFGDLLLDTVQELVLVRISFDRFRMLKTNYSTESIDKVVAEFSHRIYNLNLHNLMLFSRFYEDDFALVFEINDSQIIRNELDKILQLAERPYFIGADTIYLHFSAGVSEFPKDGNQVDILLDNAEKALHHVKEIGGDDVFWYHEGLNQLSAEKLQLETEIRNGLTAKEFFPVYQPKVNLKTGKITGFEALVRWQHPTLGVKSPAYFLDDVLEYKLSFELFSSMAEKVVKDLYKWQQNGYEQHLCINADTYDFLHPQFTDFMIGLLTRYPINERSLHLEVTENSLMQRYDVDVLARFKVLKDLNVQIALDDFGTGYASISYLRHYPFDYIKIDKSFIDDIEEENTQLLIVRAIIDLSSALNLYTVAEGIESESQADVMADMGCIVGQGYYFGKPMTRQEATEIIDAQKEGKVIAYEPKPS